MKIINLFLLCSISLVAQAQDNQFKRIASQDDILFESGKYEVPLADFVKVDSSIAVLKSDESYQFLLTAHTDADGSAQSNLVLSKKRSAAVKDYLLSKGVSLDKIKIYDFGEGKPLTSNTDEAGKKRNRRVTVEVVKYYPLVKLSGTIKSGNKPISKAKIFLKSSIYQDSAISNANGTYRINAIDKEPARMSVVAKKHFISSKNLNVKASESNQVDFDLTAATEGKENQVKDLFFYGDEARLLPTSVPSLEDLVLFMEMNPSFKIEVMGHCNFPGQVIVGPESRYYVLAENRAKSIADYLIGRQISANRIVAKGYGNSKMIFPNPQTEAESEANRRVEIKLLKK